MRASPTTSFVVLCSGSSFAAHTSPAEHTRTPRDTRHTRVPTPARAWGVALPVCTLMQRYTLPKLPPPTSAPLVHTDGGWLLPQQQLLLLSSATTPSSC